MAPLRRFAQVVNGGTPTADETNWGGIIKWATPVDLAKVDGGFVTETDRTLSAEGLRSGSASVPSGSVLLSTRAPIGYAALAVGDIAFNQGCKGLIPRLGTNGRFLRYWLSASRDELQAAGSGSTFMELSGDALLSFPVPNLHPSEQQRIADFLDDQVAVIDNIIAAREQQISLLQLEISSVIADEVVGLGLANRSRLEYRDMKSPWSGCTFPLVPIGRFVTKVRRPVPPDSEVVTAFRDGFVAPRSMRREEGFTFSDLEQGYQGVACGDLVFHGLDGFAGAFGVAQAAGRCSPVYHVMSCPNDDARYVAYALRVAAQAGLLEIQVPSTRQRAVDFRNWTTLAPIVLPRPWEAEQEQIADRLDADRSLTELSVIGLRSSIKLLIELKRSLITAAVTGEFDVSSADGSRVPA